MRLAREVGAYENPCYSRKIGSIIINPVSNKIVGTGYNGPPKGTPHCDTKEYLEDIFWPQLTISEKELFIKQNKDLYDQYIIGSNKLDYYKEQICNSFDNCQICPRRLVNARSGQRNELCDCLHSERNAITNSECNLNGCYIFCYCSVPCIQCTGTIINAGIKRVYCLDEERYHSVSETIFQKANVEIIFIDKKELD